MTPLDPPAAAARRQWVLDRIVEDLIGWGCPLEHADTRAAQVLDHALAAGYALPEALQPPPRSGPGSTDAGRAAARAAYEAARQRHQQPPGRDQHGSQASVDTPPQNHTAQSH